MRKVEASPKGCASLTSLKVSTKLMKKITIEIDSKWQKIVHSPIFSVVAALQGVAVTFAPLFLYWSAKGQMFRGSEMVIVPVCFAVIFLVPFFYYRLGGIVVKELKNK